MTGLEIESHPEMSVIQRCGGNILSDEFEAALSQEGDTVDWRSVFEFAQRHRMELLLFEQWKARSSGPPGIISEEIERIYKRTQRRNLTLTAELLALVEAFDSVGIPVLAYKGPVIASRAYGDVSLRQFGDIDLLVTHSNRQRAIECLEQRGYEQLIEKGQLFETVLKRPDKEPFIDLHTRIVPKYFPFQFSFEDLYERRASVDVGGQSIPALSTSDAILVHSIHGSKHHWSRIEWIIATAVLARQAPDLANVLDHAEEMGCERMVLLALELSRRLFDARFPDVDWRLDEKSREMQAVGSSCDNIVELLLTANWLDDKHDKRTHIEDFRLRSRLHSGMNMKLRFWLNAFTSPRPDDFEAVDLPKWLSPLYRLIRPVRLAYEYSGTVIQRINSRYHI